MPDEDKKCAIYNESGKEIGCVNDDEKMKVASKWLLRVIAICILLYLGIRYVGNIAMAIAWMVDVIKPLLVGIIIALILNVPMSFIEMHLLKNCKKGKRPLAIALSLCLIIGLFIGIAVLIIPELAAAIKLILQIVTGGLDQLAELDKSNSHLQEIEQSFAKLDVDWLATKVKLESWIRLQKDTFMDYVMSHAGIAVGSLVTIFIGIVFSVYILSQKEKLKEQVCRLVRAWMPSKMGNYLIHVADVYGKTFKLFIAGQATEAMILGTLCVVGMFILRVPYALMVGVLIGVTALIPLVGAYVGTIVGAIIIFSVNPWKAFVFVVFIIILQQVEGNAIYPRTVGAKIKLPALWVLAAVVAGGNLAGPFGMLLGVPATSATFALVKEATEMREEKIARKKEEKSNE